jgi:hypothetical protein
MTQQLDNWFEKIPVVWEDGFVQCEDCQYWLRLLPLDETGYRTIPLMNWIDYVGERHESPVKRERWVCDKCWDKLDSEEYGE